MQKIIGMRIMSNQFRANQVRSNQFTWHQFKSNQFNWIQLRSHQTKAIQLNPIPINSKTIQTNPKGLGFWKGFHWHCRTGHFPGATGTFQGNRRPGIRGNRREDLVRILGFAWIPQTRTSIWQGFLGVNWRLPRFRVFSMIVVEVSVGVVLDAERNRRRRADVAERSLKFGLGALLRISPNLCSRWISGKPLMQLSESI